MKFESHQICIDVNTDNRMNQYLKDVLLSTEFKISSYSVNRRKAN